MHKPRSSQATPAARSVRLRSALVLLALALCGASACGAQQPHFLLEETTAAGGKTTSFETAQKDYCAAVVRGGAPECLVFSPTTFSPRNRYLTLLAFGSFGHYDEGTYTSKGLTSEQGKELSGRRSPTIESNAEYAISLLPQVSYASEKPGGLILVTAIKITPGTRAALLSYIRQVELPAAHVQGLLSCELYQLVAGGDTSRFLLLRRFDKFQQLDRVVPFADAASVPGKSAPQLRRVQTTVMRVRPDLSSFQ